MAPSCRDFCSLNTMPNINLLVVFVLVFYVGVISSENCSLSCFYTSGRKEFVRCSKKARIPGMVDSVFVKCGNTNEISIGLFDSVRSLSDNFLAEIPAVETLNINLNMMNLNESILADDHLKHLNLFFVNNIHQKSFMKLPKLESIDFGRITFKDLPEYLFFRPEDRDQTINFNIEVNCMKCNQTTNEIIISPIQQVGDVNAYSISTVNVKSCEVNEKFKYCNPIKPSFKKAQTPEPKSLHLGQREEDYNQKTAGDNSLSVFYIVVIISFAVAMLLFCLIILQLWIVCQLKKITKMLLFSHTQMDSETSDSREMTNSYLRKCGVLS